MISIIDKKYFKLCCPEIGKESENDIAAKCPVCGDSKSNRKYRLHLYEKNNITFVHCFNGDCLVNNNVYNFLKLYFPEHLNNYKREVFQNNLILRINDDKDYETKDLDFNISNDWLTSSNSEINNTQVAKNTNNTQKFKVLSNIDFKPLNEAQKAYLEQRAIRNHSDFVSYDGVLDINDKKYYLKDSIITPFYYKNKIYGFYSRSIKDKLFYTCNINDGYKIWNWFNIDKTKPVYIFEGVIDAISFKEMYNENNVIAQCGISIPEERLKELNEPIFCLDNDITGLNKMLEYVMKYKCLIPNYKEKDFNDLLIKNIKHNLIFKLGFDGLISLKNCIRNL